jgi:hypothetical protein
MESRQKYGLKKFMSLGGATWRDSKYVYAISALHTSLYQLKDFIRNALHGILQLCKVACLMANGIAKVQDVAVTKWEQSNMVFLNPNYQATIMETMYIIQRSQMWLQVRKLARVTGSTIHNAIGLRGAKYQKRHISLLNAGNEDECSVDAETIKRMKHGTDNEQNALATLAGVVVPTFYPNCCYVEEGCYITQGMQQDILLVVSPDGSLRECIVSNDKNEKSYTMGKVIAAVEVKCPFPKESGVSVHYTLPQYYVCQCLAEMHALNTDKLLYMSWTDESSVVLEVKFDKDLWLEILSMISEIYDCEIPK